MGTPQVFLKCTQKDWCYLIEIMFLLFKISTVQSRIYQNQSFFIYHIDFLLRHLSFLSFTNFLQMNLLLFSSHQSDLKVSSFSKTRLSALRLYPFCLFCEFAASITLPLSVSLISSFLIVLSSLHINMFSSIKNKEKKKKKPRLG